jgi:hypothetical protein
MPLLSSTTIGDAMELLRAEIDQKQQLLSMLEAMFRAKDAADTDASSGVIAAKAPRSGIAYEAARILKASGRAMHGLREIAPALEAKGVKFNRSGLATGMIRSGLVRRVGRGTFAYVEGTLMPE